MKLDFTSQNNIIKHINSIQKDIDKIIEFEKITNNKKPFIIINKAKSIAEIHKENQVINKFDIGVGKTIGDDLNTATYKNGVFSKTGTTTPSGQFVTQAPYIKDSKTLILKGIQHPIDFKQPVLLALHDTFNNQEKLKILNSQTGRKGISSGCVNFKPEDFTELMKEIPSTGTQVYILPEEQGNSLELISLQNGLWFKTNYRDKQKQNIFEEAFKKFFHL